MTNTIPTDRHAAIFMNCIDAWNAADAERVASFYADDLDYRDPSVPGGIRTKSEFIKYLRLIFGVWPRQSWRVKDIMPHGKPGSFSVDYDFSFGNDACDISGSGMDRVEFTGDEISLNHVYLNARRWTAWLKQELAQARGTGSA